MSQRSSGVYTILERPRVYETLQRLLGAHGARRLFVDEFLRPFDGARLLDMACGPATLLDYLPAGVEYTGYDANGRYIDAARRRYGNRGRFLCARIGEEPAEIGQGVFDFVVAKSILHHLGDDDAHRMLATARRCLRPGGVFVSNDAVYYEGQPWISRLLASLDRGRRVRTPQGYRTLAESHFAEVETRLLTDMLPIPYAHFVMRARPS